MYNKIMKRNLKGQFIKGSNGNYIGTENIIRRLTPTECERLQGFPDGWTEFGWDGKFKEGHPWRTSIISISDTQRYKCLGNAVTTNVIKAIGEKLF